MKRHCLLCTVKGSLATAITPRLIVSSGVCHRSSCNTSISVIAHYEDANILLPSNVGLRWLPSPGTQGNPLAERPRSSPTQTLIKEAVNVFDALLTSCTLLTINTTCIPLLQTIALPVPSRYPPHPIERWVWTRRCQRKRSHVRYESGRSR